MELGHLEKYTNWAEYQKERRTKAHCNVLSIKFSPRRVVHPFLDFFSPEYGVDLRFGDMLVSVWTGVMISSPDSSFSSSSIALSSVVTVTFPGRLL